MLVREYINTDNNKCFCYNIDGKEYSGLAGDLLCELLNIRWSDYINQLEIHFYNDEEFDSLLLQKLCELQPPLNILFKQFLPLDSENRQKFKKVKELLGVISSKISKGEATYEYFDFILKHFYNYVPPAFPVQKYKNNILSFIQPLIEQYCPFNINKLSYQLLCTQIGEAESIVALEDKLLQLRDLLRQEVIDVGHYRYEYHSKKIAGLISWYCMEYVSLYNYYDYYEDDDFDKIFDEQYLKNKEQEKLTQLNALTNLSLIQKLCEDEDAPYKMFLIDLLYTYNNPSKLTKDKQYYLYDLFDLICHSLLFCFKGNAARIKECKFCKAYFVLTNNSQKTCLNCRSLSTVMKAYETKNIFGVDLFGVVNKIYRRLCYTGTGKNSKYADDKYTSSGLSLEQSAILVDSFKKLKNELQGVVNDICERYKIYSDAEIKEEYIEFVVAWVNAIDSYYSSKNIKSFILDMLNKNDKQAVFEIDFINLNIVHIEKEKRCYKLYK